VAYVAGEDKNHNFRASWQTGFRNPTTQDQYLGLNAGRSILVGSAPDNLDRNVSGTTLNIRNAYENSFSANSVILGNPEKADINLVKPESVIAYEVGYRGAISTGENKLSLDLSIYYNEYTDFIATENVIAPLYGQADLSDLAPDNVTPLALVALANGDFTTFTTYTNTEAHISSYGTTIGLNTKVFDEYNLGLNYTYSKFDFDQSSDPDFEAGFNTPEHKVKLQFGHPNVYKNVGFNVSARWQDDYYWESAFHDALIDSRTLLDAQINCRIPSMKSTIKLGGVNIGGKEYFSAPGVGAIGNQYYLSWTYNN